MTRQLEDLPRRQQLSIAVSIGYPWLWLCSVYTTWVVARISLGRSPRPLLDDPKLLGDTVGTVHSLSVALLMLLLPLGFISIIAGLWFGGTGRLHWKAVGTWLSALVLSWMVAVIYGRADPGHVLAWFID